MSETINLYGPLYYQPFYIIAELDQPVFSWRFL